ncbi:unnamed protein product [Pleuronectes platessa]|uniref:Uncharacterized protein n=1 Tax=Pleuronectes platessa TaxID=8262 RepID=A0A9N7VK75_PLEPL|nr:unnamed protein product [Pleuronectes platessa]
METEDEYKSNICAELLPSGTISPACCGAAAAIRGGGARSYRKRHLTLADRLTAHCCLGPSEVKLLSGASVTVRSEAALLRKPR